MRQSIRNLHPYVSLLLLLFLHIVARGGDIRGQVHFASPAQEEEISIPRYTTRPAPKMGMTASHSVRAVVYIADAFPDSNFAIPRVNPILDQRNEQFVPYILPVLVGSTVDFPNNDRVYHNVFSFSAAKTFDLGKYPTKTSKSVLFDRPGVVSVYCEIHSHMNAFILVLPNPYFCSIKEDGTFLIRAVPQGTFTLAVFAGRGLTTERKVTVPATGQVTLDISL